MELNSDRLIAGATAIVMGLTLYSGAKAAFPTVADNSGSKIQDVYKTMATVDKQNVIANTDATYDFDSMQTVNNISNWGEVSNNSGMTIRSTDTVSVSLPTGYLVGSSAVRAIIKTDDTIPSTVKEAFNDKTGEYVVVVKVNALDRTNPQRGTKQGTTYMVIRTVTGSQLAELMTGSKNPTDEEIEAVDYYNNTGGVLDSEKSKYNLTGKSLNEIAIGRTPKNLNDIKKAIAYDKENANKFVKFDEATPTTVIEQ